MPAHRPPRTPAVRSLAILAGAVVAIVAAAAVAWGLPGEGLSRRPAPGGVAIGAGRPPSAATTASTRTWTALENAKAGTPGWTVQHPSTDRQVEGYASTVSARQGDTVTLFVTSTAPTWTATAYRMGWYGGVLARQVWQSRPQPGVEQPPPARDPATNMVETRWAPSLRVPITARWPPGDYLLKLVSSTGWDSYVPLTVRDDASHSPILIINSVTTWQAYNLWGGYDLYSGRAPAGGQAAPDRSKIVSFDRPYRLGDGAGDFLGNEEKFVKLVERDGLDVSYTTDIDVHEHPGRLLDHRVVVSLGHDEYYSTAMRDALAAARDHGVNLVFLGANAVFRHIRLQPSPLGADRREVNYRVATLDPDFGRDNAEVTVSWRDPPVSRPESRLLGEMYQCNPVLADFVVTDPTAWIYAGTALTAGQRLKGLVGSEYDHYTPGEGPAVELLAQSPVVCRGEASTADATYYVAPSGAGVIDVGTNLWIPKILDDPAIGATVARITETILHEASIGPLGRTHPQTTTIPSTAPAGRTPPPGD